MRRMKSFLKASLIYLIITVIPSVTISYYFAHQDEHAVEDYFKAKAQKFANLHAMNLENFLVETVGKLEMLATSLRMQHSNLNDIETILMDTHWKDSRYSGFYWANPEGDLLISTNPVSSIITIGDRPYFQQALEAGQTSISEAHFGKVTGRYVITIVTPIKEHGNVQGALVASLRLDEINKSILGALEDEAIIVTDHDQQIIMKAGSVPLNKTMIESSMTITQVPWIISAKVVSNSATVFKKSLLENMILFLTLTNVLFLLAKYFLLRQRVKKEKEQTELHKLELIGNLAASTAHEIRNPLTGIKGLVKLLSEENYDRKSQYYFEVIQQEIDRINVIVSELLVLGKPTAYILKTYDANEIIKEIEPIIQSEANFMNVHLTIDYTSDGLLISCVKDHVKQVILNLVKNALQAMPHGGKLEISLERRLHSAVIKIIDNGIGMSKEQVKKVFNPFYSLKKDGSGLGLTVCKRIIETYNGSIMIESNLNQGTQVEITLPLLAE